MRVNVNNLTFGYTQKLILNDISFSLASGDFLTIFGKNGSGKTTFIKCLLKLVKIPNSMIFLDDIDVNDIKRFRNIGYVPQKDNFNYEFPITVSEILTSFYNHKKDELFDEIVNRLDLTKIMNENINNLSGGQIQRIFIARALLTKPKLLILDEPTVGVDIENMKAVYQILKELKEEKITIILISHDIKFVEGLSDYYLFLDDSLTYSFKKAGEK
ncbi:MAG: metal ABC transporter ATP-binding protein [Bacilli bacterium]